MYSKVIVFYNKHTDHNFQLIDSIKNIYSQYIHKNLTLIIFCLCVIGYDIVWLNIYID